MYKKNLKDQCRAGNNDEIIKKFVKYRKSNNKGKKTIRGDLFALNKLLEFTKNKSFKEINESDTQDYIRSQKTLGSKSFYGGKLCLFFRWYYNLGRKEISPNMEWFEYPSADLIRKNADPDFKVKHLITDEEYNKIQQMVGSNWNALFETLWLSGARAGEVIPMNIRDVVIDKYGKVTVKVIQISKSKKRNIPLAKNPEMLKRWLQNHPFKDNPDAPLWISIKGKHKNERIKQLSLNHKLTVVTKSAGIRKNLTPHDFRRTRATLMFASREPIFDDGEMAQFFGWKHHTVAERREQYDLRGEEELKQKLHNITPKSETFDTIKQERDEIKAKQQKQIDNLTKLVTLLVQRTGVDLDDKQIQGVLKDMDNNPVDYLTDEELK